MRAIDQNDVSFLYDILGKTMLPNKSDNLFRIHVINPAFKYIH